MATPALFDPAAYYVAQQGAPQDYIMQQTMLRVKDPSTSLKFYCETLGFKLIMHRNFPQWGFSVYFVAQGLDEASIPKDEDERWKLCMNTPGCLELTHNHGSEVVEGPVYNTGNSDATGSVDGQKVKGGFGHLGITVPCVYAACARFHAAGVEMTKSPNSGGMKGASALRNWHPSIRIVGLAFIKDPDGYLIEILPQGGMATQAIDCLGVEVDGGAGYKDNSK